CACWSGSSKERSARKVFAHTRKRGLSSKQKAGNACGFFWNHCAPAHFKMAAIVGYRSRRSSGRGREPGNRRHGILQSAGGKHHPDELSARAKARRSFEVSEGKERNSRARSWRRFRYLGHCPRPKIAAGAGDRSRLGRNDSDDETNHTKVRRRRSL